MPKVTSAAAAQPREAAPCLDASGLPLRVRFPVHGPFGADLERAVDGYFANGRSRHGGWRAPLKIAVMFSWLAASWAALVFGAPGPWSAALLAISLGLAMAGVGFGVMHDANHGSTTGRPALDRALGLSLDLIGGSSFYWRHKHNVVHHTFTNIEWVDSDIGGNGLLRFAPGHPHRPVQRFQHLYVWLLFAIYPYGWWFVDDLHKVATRHDPKNGYPRPRGAELVALLAGKAAFFSWAFLVPALVVRSWVVVPYTLLAVAALGLALATVFQLAHCVGEADFLDGRRPDEIGRDWTIHQVNTTVDFARGNRLLGWYLGGLNFQVEHHLFPRVSHVHYAALSAIVERTCAEHGVRYRAQPSFGAALAANVSWLRRMGAGESQVGPVARC
jgi:linoleoyl-CoA desaturase